MDAEEEPAPSDQVEEHLAGCQSCRRWQDAAAGLTRTLRVRPAEHTPDLTDQILAAVSVPAGQPRRATLRWALGGVAFIQLVLGLAQLLGVDHTGHLAAGDGSQHLFNESTAWNLGLAVGFLVAAVRPALARGLLPALGVFVAVLAAVSVADLVAGQVDATRVGSHAMIVAGLSLLFLVDRQHHHPAPRAGDALTEHSSRSGSITTPPADPGTGRADPTTRPGRWLRPAGRRAA